jgi:hypothetical protein
MADNKIKNSGLPDPAPAGSQIFGSAAALSGEVFLGEVTRKQLREFGWNDGDPIPPNFSNIIKVLRQEYAADIAEFEERNPQEANRARGGLFNFAGLPDAARKEIAAILAHARNPKAIVATPAATAPQPTADLPKFNPAIDDSASCGFVVDSMELPKKETALPAASSKISEDAEFIKTQIFGKPAAPSPEPAALPQLGETGTSPTAKPFCPRCFWDMQRDFPVEPTKQDVEDFVLAILGNRCFSKTYQLFDGRATMRMQAPSAKATAMIKTQLSIDVRKQRILEVGDYLATMTDYRMMFMLRELNVYGKPPTEQVFPDITTLIPRERDETPLYGYVELFYSDLVVSESLIRVARQTSFEFGALCEKLETMAIEPSFWKGIVI